MQQGKEASTLQADPRLEATVSLREHFSQYKTVDADFLGIDDLRITRCVADSRKVRLGDLFAALPGTRHDGHDFVDQAVRRGCSAVLAERPLPDLPVPTCVVPDARAAFGELCHALAGHPAKQMKVIGVTGTNGKTTTACLIARMLHRVGYRVGFLGTLGYFDGVDCDESTHTTPPADKIARYFRRMVQNGCTHVVMEASSHALDQSRMAGFSLDSLCVTNLQRDHLDYHGSIEAYHEAKAKSLDLLAPTGFGVFNADDKGVLRLADRLDGPALTIGIEAEAEISAQLVDQHRSEQTFLLCAGSDVVPVRTRMIGLHHVYNCLSAAAVGLTLGLELPEVVAGLEAVEFVTGRLQRLEFGQPFGVFLDYAHTPDALAGCLETLQGVAEGRLIVVFGAGGGRDQGKRPLLGQAAEAFADRIILTDDNPRNEEPIAILGDILRGIENHDRVEVIPDRRAAIREALKEAQPGDCVLIAGKGHETYQEIGTERIPMDDYETVRNWLFEG